MSKLIDNDFFKSKIEKFIKKNLSNKSDHLWLEYIYIYSNNYKNFIYFKKYFILSFQKEHELTFDDIYKKVINVIKNKNIKLSIYYLQDILDVEIINEILNPNKICINELNSFRKDQLVYHKYILKKTLQIDFSINNDQIDFYIKCHNIYKCKINDINNNISEIVKLYYNIKNTKRKILFVCNKMSYADDKFTEYMFEQGFWIDYYHRYTNFIKGSYTLLSDVLFKNFFYTYLYYDIIIFDSHTQNLFLSEIIKLSNNNDYWLLNILKNKMIIILRSNYTWDVYDADDKPITLIELEKSKSVNELKNKFIYFELLPLFRDNIYIECAKNKYMSNNYPRPKKIDTYVKYIQKYCTSLNDNHFSSYILKYSFNNDFILDRNSFCKINNMDPNKKIVIIFITHPLLCLKDNNIDIIRRFGFEYLIFKNYYDIFERILESFVKNNCNIIFKCHPYFTDLLNKNKNEYDYLFLKFKKKFSKNIISNCFTNEIFKYGDYGLLFSGTTIGTFNYLYNIPILSISTKEEKYDWFSSIESFTKKIYYGSFIYLEDIVNNINYHITEFINKSHKYDYYKNNPFWGNSYECTYKDIANMIISGINKNKYLNNSFNKIQLFIRKEWLDKKSYQNMQIYDIDNISVNINKNEIELNLIETPKNNYGIYIPLFSFCKYNKIYKLKSDIKISKKTEESVFFRVYDGNKWIQHDNQIDTIYKSFVINNFEFNLNNINKWRLSTTCFKKGIKIYFKNISFDN